MRRSLLWMGVLIAAIPSLLRAAACCLGSGPKSFLQLRHLESYGLGVSTSFRDVYARYNDYGEMIAAEKDQTYTTSLAASLRLTEMADAYAIVPWVFQWTGSGGATRESGNFGDVLLGARYAIYENLFQQDWYPDLMLNVGIKVPSGTVDTLTSAGVLSPGTGNGLWEPFVGFTVQKDLQWVVLSFSPAYTHRFSRQIPDPVSAALVSINEGDRIELDESAAFPITERFSLSVGSSQSWDLDRRVSGRAVPDTGDRVTSVFAGVSYFVTRYCNVSAGGDGSIPIDWFGKNQEVYRSASMTLTYAFY